MPNEDAFWKAVDDALDRIETEKPDTYNAVKAILDPIGEPEYGRKLGADESFFPGGGGDRDLMSSLRAAGWRRTWAEAHYFYAARHRETGERLTYIEGDVLRGNHMPLPDGEADGR